MNIHEYQAKQILAKYGLPVPQGKVAKTFEEAVNAVDNKYDQGWVIKAQVHAGGRGKGGGIKLVSNKDDFATAVHDILGMQLVTYQTDSKGLPVDTILIEETCKIAKELYLGAVIDRSERCLVIMASTEGGVDIEKVASETPEKIFKSYIDPFLGVLPNKARELGYKLGLSHALVKQFVPIVMGIGKLFNECDLSLIEINPLVITEDEKLLCLDAKINIDDNALYRQTEIREMRDTSQEDDRENHARDWDLNYIALDGDIGCMVNGAGLAMATMDLIKLHGGEPANFLDVGGGATKERVIEAFKLILADTNVKGVLVNIFGGIVQCDLIADGIIGAVQEVGIKIPVVVRLEGNNADIGAQKLKDSGLNLTPAMGLTDAAEKIVKAVGSAS